MKYELIMRYIRLSTATQILKVLKTAFFDEKNKGWDKTCDPHYNKQCPAIVKTKDESELVTVRATTLITTTGSEIKALNVSDYVLNSTQIIDSGAMPHMTFDSKLVHSLQLSSQTNVITVNDSATPIIGEGTIALTDNLNLDTVLVIPFLDYNLIFCCPTYYYRTLSCLLASLLCR